ASDRDKQNTTNSQIGFSLIDSPLNMHNNFTITTTWKNEESMGKISLRNSLVYEKLNKTTIELYVRAIDFGNPSLSATSTVIIHIQACSSLSSNCPCGKSLKTRVTSPTHESTDKYHPMHSIAGIKHFVFRYDPDSHVMVAITQKKCYLYIMSVTDSDDVQVTDGLRRLKTKVITMVDSKYKSYTTVSHDELSAISRSSARLCNHFHWTTYKLN
ncbi:Hypothetical predicted protein, partial [Mytilus galloprovincialis]